MENVQVSTFAGSGSFGGTDGVGTAASFTGPTGAAFDPAGNMYITEYGAGRIRKITPDKTVSTLTTGLGAPFAVIYLNGDLYVSASTESKIYRITLAGVKSVFAGSSSGYADGNGSAAQFHTPFGLASDSAGNIFVADPDNKTIRKIAPNGDVTTVAGLPSSSGTTDGPVASATFKGPSGIAVGSDNAIYISDYLSNTVRKIANGTVSTIAGDGSYGTQDGTGTTASFNRPYGMTMGNNGLLYVADFAGHKVRQVTSSGVVKTVAGTGTSGGTDGNGSTATFNNPLALSTDPNGVIVVGEYSGNRVRKISGE